MGATPTNARCNAAALTTSRRAALWMAAPALQFGRFELKEIKSKERSQN
jgi:hypothetical protein